MKHGRITRALREVVAAIGLVTVLSTACLAQDPVTEFIVRADSIASADGDSGLQTFVLHRAAIVGAAVGQLLDVAVQVGDGGDTAAEKENVAFAGRVAEAYRMATGSSALLELVNVYSTWTPKQRSERVRAKELEQKADEARGARDPETAVKLLNEAKGIYERIGDARSVAVVWGSLGVAHWGAQAWDAVLESYDAALVARQAIEDRILEGRTLNGLGSAHLVTGDIERAIDYYRRAVELRRETADLAGLGKSLNYMGNAYARLGRPVEARDAYEEALPILQRAGDPTGQYEALNNIANLNYSMGRLQAAGEAYRQAIDIVSEQGDAVGEALCRNNLADNLRQESRFNEALDQLAIVERLLESNPDPEQLIILHRNRGVVNLTIGEVDPAREDLLAALKLAKEYQAPAYEHEAMINLGYLLQQLGEYERGLSYAEKAKQLALDAQDGRMARAADMLAAELQRQMGRYDEALASWKSALEQDDYDGAKAMVLQDRLGIANVEALAGREEDARKSYRELRPLIEDFGQSDLVLSLNFGVGHSYESTNPDSAAHYYETALDDLEETRESLGGAETRTGFLGGARRYYYEEVARYYASLTKGGDGEKWGSRAFRTVERAKARGLLDLFRASMVSTESPAEQALLDSLYRLDTKAPDYAEQQRALEARYLDLREERLARSTRGLTSVVTPDPGQVGKSLPKGTVVLAYALGDSASLLWVIDRKEHRLFDLPNRDALRTDVERLRDALSRPGAGDAVLRTTARRLYQQLLQPAESQLEKAKKLVIVPDGFLFQIPFDVLLTEDASADAPWGELPFVARSYTTVYAPSVSVFMALRAAKAAKYDVDLLAVGDPDFSITNANGGTTLAPLPFTRSGSSISARTCATTESTFSLAKTRRRGP